MEDHEKILDCIRNSDEEEASKIMNIHLMRDKIDKEELKEKGIDVPNEYLDEEGMVDWLCRSALKN